ncbi:hypothetical protein BHM03_00019083 [Ensete ventricosum]|nr:hypothetical protein BHM03_00019083 [Ensete ventricosum]
MILGNVYRDLQSLGETTGITFLRTNRVTSRTAVRGARSFFGFVLLLSCRVSPVKGRVGQTSEQRHGRSACFNAVQQASVGFSSGFTVAMHGLHAASPTWVILHRLWPAAAVVDAATSRITIAIATTTVLSFNSIALSPSLLLGLDCHRKRQYGRYVVLVQYGSRDCGLSGSGDHETAAEATRLITCAAGCSLYWWMGRAAKQRGSVCSMRRPPVLHMRRLLLLLLKVEES